MIMDSQRGFKLEGKKQIRKGERKPKFILE